MRSGIIVGALLVALLTTFSLDISAAPWRGGCHRSFYRPHPVRVYAQVPVYTRPVVYYDSYRRPAHYCRPVYRSQRYYGGHGYYGYHVHERRYCR